MKTARRLVLLAAACLFAGWVVLHSSRVGGGQYHDWVIRLVIAPVFAVLLLLRRNAGGAEPGAGAGAGRDAAGRSSGCERSGRLLAEEADISTPSRAWEISGLAVGGTTLALAGIVLPVHQFEWLGLLTLLYACLRWALPPVFQRGLPAALFVLYWIHPLPGQAQGSVQLLMQRLSVRGAELVLHAVNARVWADGFWLRTGADVFGVPEACSGLRIGVTVFIYGLGVCLLFRLRWHETALFLAVGLVQVVLLNVLRIVWMVILASRLPATWTETFLHDTLGLLLLLAIVLFQLELSAWKIVRERKRRMRKAVADGKAEPPELASWLPHFWTVVRRWAVPTVVVAVIVGLLGFLTYQRRPGHRAAMIAGTISGLMENDPEAAERAVEEVRRLRGMDRGLQGQRANILVRRGKFKEALEEIRRIPGNLDVLETVIKSWALVGLGRMEEAIALIRGLPAHIQEEPGVAIIQAEYAARCGNPEDVSRNLALAAKSHRTIDRVRQLFPYLVAHEQWRAIVECRSPVPFRQLGPALVAIDAELRGGNVAVAADVLRGAWRQWPRDPRLTAALFTLAKAQPVGQWEQMFEDTLRACLADGDAERLASLIGQAFRLVRPELAWLAFRRLSEVDARDPALHLTAAQYAPVWFTFRRHQAGLRAAERDAVIDRRGEYARRRNDADFQAEWAQVPLGEEMLCPDMDAVRRTCLDAALRELERREKDGPLSYRLAFAHSSALLMAGRHDETLTRLADLEKRHPERKSDLIFQQAMVYNRQARWPEAYETARRYAEPAEQPDLHAELVMVNALINLNLGIVALDGARRAARSCPGSPLAETAEAAVWDAFGFKDQALFLLTRGAGKADGPATAQLLYDTGRTREAERVAGRLGIRLVRTQDDGCRGRIAAAEWSVTNRWPAALLEHEMSRTAAANDAAAARCGSPFVRDLLRLEAEWHRARGRGAVQDADAWARAGRDVREKAQALHRLIVLLADTRDAERARAAVDRAVSLLPDSPILRRLQVALSDGDPKVVEEARARCPDDPEVWLAWLVTRARAGRADLALAKALEVEIQTAAAAERFSVETMTRAGDYLLRQGLTGPATAAARAAERRARGFVPAYVLAMQCAIAAKDLKLARSCALAGVDHADDPKPFYAMIVNLSFAQGTLDSDLIAALEYLKAHFPKESKWTEGLGHACFHQGDPARALNLLSPAIGDDLKSARMQSVLLAAESARLEGKTARALSILEAANAAYPGNLCVLNNLVYSLAQDPATVARARALLPELLELGGEQPAVQDTAALVCLNSGRLDDAEQHSRKALAGLRENDYATPEACVNAARIQLARGDEQAAGKLLETALRNAKCPKRVETEARALARETALRPLERAVKNAEGLIGHGRIEEARRALKTALADPNCGDALETKVRGLLEATDPAKKGR
ncbi:MAG: archaeosortase/exosortase family protein [Verrucomicrobiota bacterium]|nr:archaeosortase/exosortase family protein [Verrucomicrobiota bacterium]